MDYTYLFNLMCQRRLVNLSKVESVAMTTQFDFGIVDGTYLLPVVADAFYYVEGLGVVQSSNSSGIPRFRLGGFAGFSGASPLIAISPTAIGTSLRYEKFECNSIQYDVNNWTSGFLSISGTVFKITYIA